MSQLAPVVVFAYRRPDHLRKTLNSLMLCQGFLDSPVIVYVDGPRNENEIELVKATQELAVARLGERAEYRFSEANLGLSRSIIAGVGNTLERFGRVVVLEDDLELAPTFLTYMNSALERFAVDEEVFQVSGFMFDVPELESRSEAILLPMTVSWGWGTWKRAWDKFDLLATGWELLQKDTRLRYKFNLNGAYDYSLMLESQMTGKIDSWAVRWYWTVFNAGGLTLFPPLSLVRNCGFDGSGSHGSGRFRNFANIKRSFPVCVPSMPISLRLTPEIDAHVFKAIKRSNGGIWGWLIDSFRRLILICVNHQ
jgi:hypothetical protein